MLGTMPVYLWLITKPDASKEVFAQGGKIFYVWISKSLAPQEVYHHGNAESG